MSNNRITKPLPSFEETEAYGRNLCDEVQTCLDSRRATRIRLCHLKEIEVQLIQRGVLALEQIAARLSI